MTALYLFGSGDAAHHREQFRRSRPGRHEIHRAKRLCFSSEHLAVYWGRHDRGRQMWRTRPEDQMETVVTLQPLCRDHERKRLGSDRMKGIIESRRRDDLKSARPQRLADLTGRRGIGVDDEYPELHPLWMSKRVAMVRRLLSPYATATCSKWPARPDARRDPSWAGR